MSSYKGFRTGSNSYGQFWFGGSTFPGFLYKKNVGEKKSFVICDVLTSIIFKTDLPCLEK